MENQDYFVPLSECHLTTEETGITIDFSPLAAAIPEFVDAKKIEINILAIHQICRQMRIKTLRVCAFSEKGEEEVNITGINDKGGSATAAGTARKTPAKNKGQISPLNEDILRANQEFFAQIAINTQAIREQIERAGAPLRDIEQWQNTLDQFLKEELKKLLKKNTKPDSTTLLVEFTAPLAVVIILIIASEEESKLPMAGRLLSLITAMIIIGMTVSSPFIAYLALLTGSKLEYHKLTTDKSNPLTPFTLGEWEWDHILATKKLLKRQLVRTAIPAETITAPQQQTQ